MTLEYWLEARDACDAPRPNVTKSDTFRVKLTGPGDAQEQKKERRNVAEKTRGRDVERADQGSGQDANAAEDAKALLVRAEKELNPTESIFTEVSPTVGTHAGPGTVGLAFMAGM